MRVVEARWLEKRGQALGCAEGNGMGDAQWSASAHGHAELGHAALRRF